MAAQGGLQLRVSWGREKREDERERRNVTGRYALRSSAPTREERERERLVEPTERTNDRSSFAGLLTSLFFFASCSEGGDKTRSSFRPSQYPLLGFKDRHLEDEYLEHLVVASRARIILGYVTAILLYGSELFASLWVNYDIIIWIGQLYGFMSDEQKEDFKEG